MEKSKDILERIADKSWGHGLCFELGGKFNTERELEKILDSYGIDKDNAETLMNEGIGYAYIYSEEIEGVQVENENELWVVNNELSTFDGLCDKLYKDKKGNYILGFAYDTFDIRFAIDILTATIGVINFDNEGNATYEWKYTMQNEDIEMLQRIIEENDMSLDDSINITRNNLSKLPYPVA
ncbi:hypothetical protein [Liquorilactobacillus mali]|uniref:Uncharacterized protein n=1 Tax=Liquorilactobacillus mali KCTC 3596 = DSM 20444 TaxID=1046596 RepID=A0A0R2EA18_9LACO|nr:hypothetical protein [Liquorilactobacillus mali]KRN10805.1 hypothetical protein FD00_GL002047 [Liquorilactobacillus mali KCTC 3596 = DSM 20444]